MGSGMHTRSSFVRVLTATLSAALLSACGVDSTPSLSHPSLTSLDVTPTASGGLNAQLAAKRLTVVTFNVNYGLASGGTVDKPTLDAIAALDADIVFFQETNAEWERAIRGALGARLPHAKFHDPTSYVAGGAGIMSRFPFREEETIPSPLGWFPAQRAVVDSPDGPLQLLNLHLRPAISERGSWVEGWFTTGPLRERELAAYAPHLAPDVPTLIAGDFNEEDGGATIRTIRDNGFYNALPQTSPSATTWRWNVSGVPLAFRLDHVLYQPQSFRLVSAHVLDEGKSDHLPVRVVLERGSEVGSHTSSRL